LRESLAPCQMSKLRKWTWLSLAFVLWAFAVAMLSRLSVHWIERHADNQSYGKAETLNCAIISGDIPKIQAVITENRTVLDATDWSLFTPMNCAVNRGRRDIVELLIKNGANINRGGPTGFTPLHCAAQQGNKEMVGFLLASGAKINAKDDEGITPLHMAVNARHKEVVEILVLRGADLSAKGRFLDSIPRGSDLYTPLQRAIKIHADDVADFLRTQGAKE